MNEDLISVIIPVYNAEKYLSACLDSVLSQSYRYIEVIIINDGSTDFSLKVAETYAQKDDRISIYNQLNKGQAEARNKGLSVATGKYLTFIDADDVLLPAALQVLYEELKDNDIIEGKVIKGKNYGYQSCKEQKNVKLYSPIEAIENVLYQYEMLPSPCGKLYKTSLFDNIRFSSGLIYEDLDIFYKIFDKACKITYIKYPVYFYRDNESSTINTWNPKRLDVLKVTEYIENFISINYPKIMSAAKDRRLSANFNMFALCSIHGDKENADKCWEIIKKYRKQSLFNPKVRLKNKAGILLSYFGKNIFKIAAGWVYN